MRPPAGWTRRAVPGTPALTCADGARTGLSGTSRADRAARRITRPVGGGDRPAG
ncbi:MAG: hypothetical protein AVDCRST_MAG41-3938 [uncultured Corynebacteriales bacterium]|uniref:Uncharacterized protein n=1 Tax=uncultured Mycobacteriales bacterium TaxID=581187 RepID=A0A6J4JR90_9ACTN|nr:MAG: hypothetical protein AVDCRST_MAG41-3938 [uncultured Corynebacteriales bacterium]